MLTFSTVKPQSPVDQAFIWLAEYVDGQSLTEFDLVNGVEHEFTEIDQPAVTRFGLIGQGVKVWFERSTGAFNVAGQHVAFVFTDAVDHALPGSAQLDLITYKRAEFDVKTRRSEVSGFYVGYKTFTNVAGGAWFKAIVSLNAGEVPFVDTTTTFTHDVTGCLSMYVNFKKFASVDITAKRGESANVKFALGR